MKKAILLCGLLLGSIFIATFAQDSRGYIIPSERAGRPRPTPPSCCRPFRADDVFSSRITTSNIFNANSSSNITYAEIPEDVVKYKSSLENYKSRIDSLKRSNIISNSEYKLLLAHYKLRIIELEIKELEKINPQ
jgi:hypothetical protein